MPKNNNKGIENCVRGFMSEYGDHLTALSIYNKNLRRLLISNQCISIIIANIMYRNLMSSNIKTKCKEA